MATKAIPEGYTTVTPYLCMDGAAKALDFYKKAFNATEIFQLKGPDGKIGHAEIKIGNSILMLADEYPDMNFKGPKARGGTSVHIHLYVENSDAAFDQALQAGAKSLRPVMDQFYGDRSGSVEDPFGHVWHLATHKEDLSQEEINKRAAELFAKK